MFKVLGPEVLGGPDYFFDLGPERVPAPQKKNNKGVKIKTNLDIKKVRGFKMEQKWVKGRTPTFGNLYQKEERKGRT